MKIKEVISSPGFKRSFKKLCIKNPMFKEDFQSFFKNFAASPQEPQFKLHKLKGKLANYYSAKIEYDLRLIFEYENETALLIDIGTHDKVY